MRYKDYFLPLHTLTLGEAKGAYTSEVWVRRGHLSWKLQFENVAYAPFGVSRPKLFKPTHSISIPYIVLLQTEYMHLTCLRMFLVSCNLKCAIVSRQ